MSDRAKVHFDKNQRAKIIAIKKAGSTKQDARPAAQFKTTPETKGLGTVAKP
jgi:hypothetical protein